MHMRKQITAMVLSLAMFLSAAPGNAYAFDWGDAASDLLSGLSDASDSASQIAEQAAQGVSEAAQNASQIAGGILAGWSDDLDELAQTAEEIFSGLQVSLEGWENELETATSGTIDSILDSMGLTAQELADAAAEASDLITDTAGNVIDMASQNAQEVSEAAQSVVSVIREHGEMLSQIAQEAISDLDLSDPDNLKKARAAAEEAVKEACEQGVLGVSLSGETAELLAGIVSSTVIYGTEYGAGELTLSDYAQRMSELILNAGIPVGVGFLASGLPVGGSAQPGRDVMLYLLTLVLDKTQDPGTTKQDAGGISLSEDQQYWLALFAQKLYTVRMGDFEYSEDMVRAAELTAQEQAFLLYWYQYGCSDSRIADEGEWHTALKDDLDAVLRDLFGENLQEDTLEAFLDGYADRIDGDLVYMNAVGDFGDAGSFYFARVSDCRMEGDLLAVSGAVMEWNGNMECYVHRNMYTAYFHMKPAEEGKETQFSIESVSIGF